MNVIRVHEITSACFLIPFSSLCVSEIFLGYVVYPMFLTHALTFYMSYELVWIYIQPRIIHSFPKLIILHHIMALIYAIRPLYTPEEAYLTAYLGLVEIDTSMLVLKHIFPKNQTIREIYLFTNVFFRVWYESFMSLVVWFLYDDKNLYVRIHVMTCQLFFNIFSCGICALTYRALKNKRLKDV